MSLNYGVCLIFTSLLCLTACGADPDDTSCTASQTCVNEIDDDDADEDGILDEADLCPNTPDGATVDLNGCTVVIEIDTDNDGVIDAQDLCPNTLENVQVNANGCAASPATDVLVQAEDYANYHDTTAGNTGGSHHSDDVDIEASQDTGGGFNVGWTAANEWLEYNVTLAAGTFEVSARVASEVSSGRYSIKLDGNQIGTNTVSSTGGWQVFQTHSVGLITVSGGNYSVRIDINGGEFNFNWIKFSPVSFTDADQDGVHDLQDLCPDTAANKEVGTTGCEVVLVLNEVARVNDFLVGGIDSSKPGFALYTFDNDEQTDGSTCDAGCATNWPPVLVTDSAASGAPRLSVITRNDGTLQAAFEGKPLYFYVADTNISDNNGHGVGGVWWLAEIDDNLGDIISLFSDTTALEPVTQFDRGDALVTRLSDRGRDRHAKEDQYQIYDHYLTFYWENRTASIEIVDYVAKGGDTITMNVTTQWKLSETEAENRWWYLGMNTIAQYYDNGTMESTDDLHYSKSRSWNPKDNRAIQVGDRMEFEMSQFLAPGLPRGRHNYYGTTFLYIVGEGIVPWLTRGDFDDKSTEREDSFKIPEAAWLAGHTTLPYMYTNEPDNHFMQMPTNLNFDNAQPFVLGRRIHHTDFVSGQHDESVENGIFPELVGKSGTHYVNSACSKCHVRNGRAAPANIGVPLDKWVFKIGDAAGEPDPDMGRVLQPKNVGINNTNDGEGTVAIESWTEENNLRSPNYSFSRATPDTFSARIAPQLVGLGLLEAIPETQILALADETDTNDDGISGKAQRVLDPVTGETRLGRFGWKAATSSVEHQVAGALNSDMGVMTSVLPSPDCGTNQSLCGNSGTELSDEHLNNLVKYISLLGVRPQRNHDDAAVQLGKTLFTTTDCTSCHTQTFQTSVYHPLAELRDQTIHPYTDMLLHDMGPGLADNLGEGLATGAEWRTTPLWGIGLSACVTGGVTNPTGHQGDEVCTPNHSYLHDGRARSIEEAILWHGGEGLTSKNKYEALPASQKQAMLRFLESL